MKRKKNANCGNNTALAGFFYKKPARVFFRSKFFFASFSVTLVPGKSERLTLTNILRGLIISVYVISRFPLKASRGAAIQSLPGRGEWTKQIPTHQAGCSLTVLERSGHCHSVNGSSGRRKDRGSYGIVILCVHPSITPSGGFCVHAGLPGVAHRVLVRERDLRAFLDEDSKAFRFPYQVLVGFV